MNFREKIIVYATVSLAAIAIILTCNWVYYLYYNNVIAIKFALPHMSYWDILIFKVLF